MITIVFEKSNVTVQEGQMPTPACHHISVLFQLAQYIVPKIEWKEREIVVCEGDNRL